MENNQICAHTRVGAAGHSHATQRAIVSFQRSYFQPRGDTFPFLSRETFTFKYIYTHTIDIHTYELTAQDTCNAFVYV